jgi:hypothetical protein
MKWRIVAFVDAVLFLGLLLLAISVQPVWLGAVILVVGLFASAWIWIVVTRIWRRKPASARKIPK